MKTSTMILVGGGIAIAVYYVARKSQPAPGKTTAGSVLDSARALWGSLSGSNAPTAPPVDLSTPGGIVAATGWAAATPTDTNPYSVAGPVGSAGISGTSGTGKVNRNFAPTQTRPFTFQQANVGGSLNYSQFANRSRGHN